MASLSVLNAQSSSMTRYLQEIQQVPFLSQGEERELAYRWRDYHDLEAAHKLVSAHLRLVAKIAARYRGYQLPIGDLISEGNIGLMQAVKRFDPDRGCRFSTYAIWWIRAAMQEYILHSWSMVKIGTTGAQKKLFFNLRKLKSRMGVVDDGDLKPEQACKIAQILNVPEMEVISMDRRLASPDYSLNISVRSDSEDDWQSRLIDETTNQEATTAEQEEITGRKVLLPAALKALGERERQILIERRLKDSPLTLEVLAQQHGISRERVRQIELRAFQKLQKTMTAAMTKTAA